MASPDGGTPEVDWNDYPDAVGVPTAGTALVVGTGKSVERGRPATSRPDELRLRLAAWPRGRKQEDHRIQIRSPIDDSPHSELYLAT